MFEVPLEDTTVPYVKYSVMVDIRCEAAPFFFFLADICKNVNRNGRGRKSSASEMRLTQPVHQDMLCCQTLRGWKLSRCSRKVRNSFRHMLLGIFNPYPTAFPYGNGMVLHFYQQQESSTTKTVHKVINKGLKTYV